METFSPSSHRGRIAPAVSQDTEFFWEATARHKLAVQRCAGCGQLRHPPGPICPNCRSLEWDVAEVSGRGTIFSYMIQHHPPVPGFDQPTVVVMVDLQEGPRIVSNLVDVDPAGLEIGAGVHVSFVDQDEGWTAHQFRLDGAVGGEETPE